MMTSDHRTRPHRRLNPLTGEWLLLSPQRTQRPWQGRTEETVPGPRPQYDPDCYLCPGNTRMQGLQNDVYQNTFVFDNDFKALTDCRDHWREDEEGLFCAESAEGTCRVVCFSPRHDQTLAEMDCGRLRQVVDVWVRQTRELHERYRWVQIFENKGALMGCSNPHPHCQVWASDFIPEEPFKENRCQREYLATRGSNLLLAYLAGERRKKERIVAENEEWVCLVPYWAVWPFETLLLPTRHTLRLSEMGAAQCDGLAAIMQELLVKYDNIFGTSFPYSMGWHGAPADGEDNGHWQLHAHYYPPLLRSAEIRKFMVGYEMLGCPQRDILPEQAAELIRRQSPVHYTQHRG